MVAELLLIAACGVSAFLGAALGMRFRWRGRAADAFLEVGPHEHEFDYMIGDGFGWRCGVCGVPKAREVS